MAGTLGLGFAITGCQPAIEKRRSFYPAQEWRDSNGALINAHGGGILYHEGTYYWFGEIKRGPTSRVDSVTTWECYRTAAEGVACYSSQNLIDWTDHGIALAANYLDPSHELHTSKVIERPKVIYNRSQETFVMWFHLDVEDYSYARAGVAISDHPLGPYRFLKSYRPNGQESRDLTLFKDEDQRAYLVYSSENNQTLRVNRLSPDYLSPSLEEKRILVGEKREAPAVFKSKDRYYLLSSACTGWDPSETRMATADSMLGDWQLIEHAFMKPHSQSSFGGQVNFVLPVSGQSDAFIFMSDIWKKKDLKSSLYMWLPLVPEKGGFRAVWE
ncbi:MAG: glycoside hydrolase family 43 protein, partial [Bacteroidota bacterium]